MCALPPTHPPKRALAFRPHRRPHRIPRTLTLGLQHQRSPRPALPTTTTEAKGTGARLLRPPPTACGKRRETRWRRAESKIRPLNVVARVEHSRYTNPPCQQTRSSRPRFFKERKRLADYVRSDPYPTFFHTRLIVSKHMTSSTENDCAATVFAIESDCGTTCFGAIHLVGGTPLSELAERGAAPIGLQPGTPALIPGPPRGSNGRGW